MILIVFKKNKINQKAPEGAFWSEDTTPSFRRKTVEVTICYHIVTWVILLSRLIYFYIKSLNIQFFYLKTNILVGSKWHSHQVFFNIIDR